MILEHDDLRDLFAAFAQREDGEFVGVVGAVQVMMVLAPNNGPRR